MRALQAERPAWTKAREDETSHPFRQEAQRLEQDGGRSERRQEDTMKDKEQEVSGTPERRSGQEAVAREQEMGAQV